MHTGTNITVCSQDFSSAHLQLYVSVVIQSAQSTRCIPQGPVLHVVRRTVTSGNTLSAVRISVRLKTAIPSPEMWPLVHIPGAKKERTETLDASAVRGVTEESQ